MNISEMTAEQIHTAFVMMERIGGHFASALAKAFYKADSGNQARIIKAFPDLIEEYYAAYKATIRNG